MIDDRAFLKLPIRLSFKPYYKWIIFNITLRGAAGDFAVYGFKPYYKWIIFNIPYRF